MDMTNLKNQPDYLITVGSLFSGIGGIDLGLERAGMEIRWQVEIDDFCNKVLKKHWPNIRRFKDVKEVGKHNLEKVWLICGGFPCQPFSVAGKQKGDRDDRNLWPEMFRVISEIKPPWVLGENVIGILKLVLDNCISDLESLGYEVQSFIIPAYAVNAPHRRDRVWIMAFNKGFTTHSIIQRLEREITKIKNKKRKERCLTKHGGWTTEPKLGGVVQGIPNRMDRIRCLGNSVVPQIVEELGKFIIKTNNILLR